MHICNRCTYLDLKGKSCLVPGTQPCCSECGCSLEFKTRSLSSECPKGKWKAWLTEEEEEKLEVFFQTLKNKTKIGKPNKYLTNPKK